MSTETKVEPWTHGYAQVERDVRLHFVEQGSGPLLIMLHGFPEFWYSWRHQIPALAEAGYHVVAPDLRGYNESDRPKGVRRYRIERLTADVMALIEHFGAQEAVILAHDWGGGIAWQFALDYPQATSRLIVMNAPHPAAFAANMRRGRLPNFRQLRRSWYMFFFQIPWLPEFLLGRNVRRFVEGAFRGQAISQDAFTDADIDAFVAAASKPGAIGAGINYYRAAFRGGMGARIFTGRGASLPKITAPTLVIWGEQDQALGKELTHGMEQFFAGPFEIKYIPNASHWVQQEEPDLCNQYIKQFLAQQAEGSPTPPDHQGPPPPQSGAQNSS